MRNINTDSINGYIETLIESGISHEKIVSKLKNIDKYIFWAFKKGQISSKKFEQIKFLIANRVKDFEDKNNHDSHAENAKQDQNYTQILNTVPTIQQFDNAIYHGEKNTDGLAGEISVKFKLETYKIKSVLKGILRHIPLIGSKIKNNQEYNSTSVDLQARHYLTFGLIMLILSFLSIGIYNQFFKQTNKPQAFPTSLTRGSRTLSFQGRLTDSLGNPIITSTNVVFKLHTAASGGSQLYTSGTCAITPDQDGILSTVIGEDCGAEIDSATFSENSEVFLGITVGSDSEMTPRQQIANVGYAINAETLQGFPPEATKNSIPFIDNQGDVRIAATSPSIVSNYVSQTFLLGSAAAVTLQSAGAGDVTLTATESGTIKFLTGGTQAGVVTNGQLWGMGTTGPDAKIDSLSTAGEQLRLSYADGTVYAGFTVDSAGTLTIATAGSGSDIVFNPEDGQVEFADTDTLNVGGKTDLAYNAFANSADAPEEADISSDNDLYIGGDLEVDGTIFGSITASALAWSGLTAPTADLTLSHTTYNTTFNWDPTADATETAFTLNFDGEDSSTDQDQILLALNQTSNGVDVTEAADALLTFANYDANDPVENAIRFDAGGAGTDFTYGINFDASSIGTAELVLQNGETIDNVVDGTIGLTGNATISGTTGLTFSSTGGIILAGGTISDGTDGVDIADDLEVTGTTTLAGTLDANGQADIGDGGDSLTLNGTTVIIQNTGAGNDITLNAVDQIILTDFTGGGGGCTALETDGSGNLVCGSDAGGSTAWDDIGDPDATGSIAFAEYSQTMDWDLATDVAKTALSLTFTNDVAGSNTQYLLNLDNLNDGGSNGVTESLLVIDNSDTNEAVTDGILFVNAGGGFTDFIDTPSSVFKVDGSGNVTGVNFTSSGTTGLTFSSTGGIILAGGTLSDGTDGVDIADDLEISGGTTLGDAIGDTVTANAGAWTFANDTTIALSGGLDGLNFDSNTLSIDAANDRVGFGTTGPDARIDSLSTSGEQLRLTYADGSSYSSFTTNVSGDLTITPSGSDTTFTDNISVNGNTSLGNAGTDTVTVVGKETITFDTALTNQNGLTISASQNTATGGTLKGLNLDTNFWATSGTQTGVNGLDFTVQSSGNGGTVSYMKGISAWGIVGTGSTVNDFKLVDAANPTNNGTIASLAGYVVNNLTSGSNNTLILAGTSSIPSGNWGIYNSSSYTNFLSGTTGIGTTGADAKLDVLSTTEQLRLTYTDGSVYAGFTTDSSGDLSIDATGGDVTLASGDNLNLTSSGDLIFGGTTTLAESTGATDSGAYFVGVFDEFANSNGTNVQDVLDDLDAAIAAGSGPWTDSGTTSYLTDTTDEVVIGGSTPLSSAKVSIDGDSNQIQFLVQGDATQATSLAVFEDSTGTDLATISSAGILAIPYLVDISNASYGLDPAGTSNFGGYSQKITGGALLAYDTGSVGIGTAGPDAKLDVASTTEQLRLSYTDGAVYSSHTVDSSGNLTIDNTGTKTIIADDLQVTGNDILDSSSTSRATLGATTTLTNTALTLSGTATLTASSLTAFNCSDCIDFDDLEDTLDVDTAVTLNQGTNIWTQNFTGTTTTGLTYNADSLSTGIGELYSFDALSSGIGVSLTSISTALTSGSLLSLDWSPTTTNATGDLFKINIGSSGNVGNLLNITDNTSSLFRVAENQIESSVPHSFSAPGDVSVAYDLVFSNQTASYIKSNAPLYIEAGESFESNDLSLKTYNSGDLVLDLAGGVTFAQAQAWDLANSSTTSLNIESGLLNLDTTNSRVGIGTTAPVGQFEVNASSTTMFVIDDTRGDISKGNSHGVNALNDQSSLAPNSSFEVDSDATGLPDGWLNQTGTSTTTTTSKHGTTAINLDDQTDTIYSTCFPIAANSSRTYTVSIWGRSASGGIATGLQAGLYGYTSNSNCQSHTSANTQTPVSTAALSTTYTAFTGTATPTSGDIWARAFVKNNNSSGGEDIYADGLLVWPTLLTSGLDLAETHPTDPNDFLIPGELVSFGETNTKKIGLIRRTNSAYDNKLFGVVATQPGYLLDDNDQYPKAQVALKGRVPVRVITENGNIAVGDAITASSMPGVAMKATRPSKIVGYAMTGYQETDRNKIGTITLFVNPEYFSEGTLTSNQIDQKIENKISSLIYSLPNITFEKLKAMIINTQQIIAETINAGNATIDSIIAKTVTTEKLVARNIVTNDIVAKNKITAKTIESDNIASLEAGITDNKQLDSDQQNIIASLNQRLRKVALEGESNQENLSTQVSKIQQTLADIDTEPIANPNYYQDLETNSVSSLTVSTEANIYDLFVTNIASLGNITIQDNVISSSMGDLNLTALSEINLMDGAVVIAKNGTITTKGAIIAKGGVLTDEIKSINKTDVAVKLEKNADPDKINEFQIKDENGHVVSGIDEKGKARFTELALDAVDTASDSGTIIAAGQNLIDNGINAPAIITNGAVSGTASMPAGAIDLVVFNQKITANSLIYLTPTTPTQNNNIYIAYKEPCSVASQVNSVCKPFFKVSIDSKVNTDVQFNWLIINRN